MFCLGAKNTAALWAYTETFIIYTLNKNRFKRENGNVFVSDARIMGNTSYMVSPSKVTQQSAGDRMCFKSIASIQKVSVAGLCVLPVMHRAQTSV